jgi:hypothetical protein
VTSISGVFNDLAWRVISSDRGFSLSYPDGQRVVLEVVAMTPLAGDLDGDGFVGLADLDVVLVTGTQVSLRVLGSWATRRATGLLGWTTWTW